jgi:hypothetical protein
MTVSNDECVNVRPAEPHLLRLAGASRAHPRIDCASGLESDGEGHRYWCLRDDTRLPQLDGGARNSRTKGALWGSWTELREDFYRPIAAAPVPVDMRALRPRSF